MFWTAHTAISLAISPALPHPLIGFAIGYLSHFIADAIPHGDEALFDRYPADKKIAAYTKVALIDSCITLGLIGSLFYFTPHTITDIALATILGSLTPDWLSGLYILKPVRWLRWNHTLNEWAHRVFFKNPTTVRVGFSIQALTVALALLLIF